MGAGFYDGAVTLEVARQSHIHVGVEFVEAPIVARVALDARQYDGYFASERMSAHQVEHAQPADAGHFQTKEHQLRHVGRAARKYSRRKQVVQSFASVHHVQYAGARRHLFESNERGLRIQQVVVDDENIGAWNHTSRTMKKESMASIESQCARMKFRLE
ncbi:hypothetical protein [Steroidobacter agaridevorans]|uniref:hypothetical protein n=1 Tax=Steroidobacter agaridevorans TaxID=2695856 RepID=UPI0013795ABC|nr:hypothetical protein [Steroidobacter agaridevorans]